MMKSHIHTTNIKSGTNYIFVLELGLVMAFTCCQNAYAKDDALLSLSLEELLKIKVEVASGYEENLIDSASSITIFTREQIQNMGVRSVEELLRFVPGFQVSRDTFVNNGYRVGARGMLTGTPSYSILFLIDGQRLNSDMAGGALFDNKHITTANIERVEIIRGPGSAIYGTNAFSGIVSITTTKNLNNVTVAAGNLGSKELSVNANHTLGDWHTSWFFRAYADEGDNYSEQFTQQVDPLATQTRDPYTAIDISASASLSDLFTLDLRHHNRKFNDFINFRYVNNGVAKAESGQDSIAVSGTLYQQNNWKVDARLSYSQWQTTQIEELFGQLGEYRFGSSEWSWALSAERIQNKHHLSAGFDVRTANISDYDFVEFDSGTVVPQGTNTTRDIYGFYVQDQYKFSDQLSTTIGLRVDHTSKMEIDVNPRAALIYKASNEQLFKLLYGEAFRTPNRFQTDDIFIGNPDIKSEKVQTLEAVWMQDWLLNNSQNYKFQSTATIFYSRHKNRINLKASDGPFGFHVENDSDSLNTSGLELEASLSLSESSLYRIAYTYLPNTEENPQSFANNIFSLIATHGGEKWTSNVNLLYQSIVEQGVGSTLNSSIAKLDSYWLVNASYRYHISPKTDLYLNLYNLMDESYYSPSTIRVLRTGLENRGRSIMVGAEVLF